MVGSDGVTARTPTGPVEFAAGDVVVITRNHRALGVLNGMRGQVAGTDQPSGAVIMADDLGELHALPADLLGSGDVQHGYALTIHRAQGATFDTALVYGTAALSKEAGYVALSRGRVANHLFASPDDIHDAVLGQPFGDERRDLLAAVEQVSIRLAVSRRQSLAASYLPQPRPPERPEISPQPIREMRGLSR